MTDLSNRLVIVTGANSGVGYSVSGHLLEAGARVVLVCRDRERGEHARASLESAHPRGVPELEIADLSDLSSVRDLAARLARFDGIEALVNNAGVWRAHLERTAAGLEVTMATNHLGHFLLTHLLRPQLSAGGNRVVNVSSRAHYRADLTRAPFEDICKGDAWRGGLEAYSDSKLANVVFTVELVRRYGEDGLVANAVHPGVLRTMIWNKGRSPVSWILRMLKPLMGSADVGGRAVMRLLEDPERRLMTGAYFDVEEVAKPAASAGDEALGRRLWETSALLTGLA
ncbi:MAG: SDR family NAD(P)-dependent oxidoreductase [Gemmatimonadota bacterium]|nr:SDR family NAD(P)-dependent oxidoreductase [Gemmatimonadota bacterium]